MESVKEKHLKVRQGIVVSTKMDKTIVVRVERRKKHPLYKKTIKISKNYKAHDEKNECNEGDSVRIIECRPISKHKSYRLEQIVERAQNLETVKDEDVLKEVLSSKTEKEEESADTAKADETEA